MVASTPAAAGAERIAQEAQRRRTFAIISHPDAGKTTLTEKLLLYGGALAEAGAVQARRGRRAATSDWMELERRRGISVTSTALRFDYKGITFNLLDTPGHRDFSEDTLRVIAAADSAVMLLDAARGIEAQTTRLFDVARSRGIPLIAVVFKVQANMDPRHRDRMAFMRIVSGRFERGMRAINARTGRPFAMSYASDVFGSQRETLQEAFPGDVIGVVGASELLVGDTLYLQEPVRYPPIPTLAPEHFVIARNSDAARHKQFHRGLAQLAEEGVVHLLQRDPGRDPAPVLGAVGPLQFDVAAERMAAEFGVTVRLQQTPWKLARRTDQESALELARRACAQVLSRTDGTLLALFTSHFALQRVQRELPNLTLEALLRR